MVHSICDDWFMQMLAEIGLRLSLDAHNKMIGGPDSKDVKAQML